MIKFQPLLFLFILLGFAPDAFSQSGGKTVNELFSDVEVSKKVKFLGDECWRLRELDSDSALVLGEEALRLAIVHDIKKELPRLYGFMGVIQLHYMYRPKESLHYLHSSLEQSVKQKDSIQLAFAYNNLGDLYLFTGNIPLSLKFSEQSLELFTEINYSVGKSYSNVNMGLVHREKKNYNLALDYFNEAIVIWEEMGEEIGIGAVYLEMAKTYEDMEDLDIAMLYYQKSLQRTSGEHLVRYAAFCLHGMANIYYKRNNLKKAHEYYQKGIQRNLERNHEFGLIDDYIGLAFVYAKQNRREEGEMYLEKAMDISRTLGLNSKILKVNKSFANFYQILNDFKKSTECYNRFLHQYDSIFSIQQFEIITEMQNGFSMQKSLLDTEEELDSQKTQEIYLLVIILLVLIIAGVIYGRFISHRNLNRKLSEINQSKDKLFSVISHDLKNPFNSLIGFSELLLSEIENRNYEKSKRFATYLNQASVEGLKLLTNLLHWSLSQTGRIQYNPELVNFNDLFTELKEFYELESKDYNVNLSFENLLQDKVSVDFNILRIIIINLVSNALKYTMEGGVILVTASSNDNKVKIKVRDTGIGMSKERLNSIFDKGTFVESKKGLRDEHGTGLGLNIVDELVQIHKGEIKVKSEEGKGTTFELEFPLNLSNM